MVRDLDVPVLVVGRPIVREPDGLAMSSRNAYLSPPDRQRALLLSRALQGARKAFDDGAREAVAILAAARAVLAGEPAIRVDYLELRDAESLHPIEGQVTSPAVLAVAAFVGTTRLIDNILLP